MQNVRKSASYSGEQRRGRQSQLSAPEIVDIDVLSTMSDNDLQARFRALDVERNQVIAAQNDPRAWDEELAYVKREMQIRRIRRELHEQYVRALEREYVESERDLPDADLDNSSFIWFN